MHIIPKFMYIAGYTTQPNWFTTSFSLMQLLSYLYHYLENCVFNIAQPCFKIPEPCDQHQELKTWANGKRENKIVTMRLCSCGSLFRSPKCAFHGRTIISG